MIALWTWGTYILVLLALATIDHFTGGTTKDTLHHNQIVAALAGLVVGLNEAVDQIKAHVNGRNL